MTDFAEVWEGPLGWVCPVCRHVWAPMEPECTRCAVRIAPPPPLAPAAPRLTVRLPDCMGFGGILVSPVTGTWTEVFPGLEVNLRSVRQGLAEVEFRAA